MTKAEPAAHRGVSPYLCVKSAAAAVEFYKKAFGAGERMRFEDPSGGIGHVEVTIGEATIMLADENPQWSNRSPQSLGGTTVSVHLYVDDVDAFFSRAVAAGAKALQAPEDQFYGDRAAKLEDPFGHVWLLATRKEDLSEEEMQARFKKLLAGG